MLSNRENHRVMFESDKPATCFARRDACRARDRTPSLSDLYTTR